jgi:hypothetical protein
MSSRRPALRIEFLAQARADLDQLEEVDPKLADAAFDVVEDVANHRKRGKELGKRNLTGDLGGLFRLKFDRSGVSPERYRAVYELPEPGVITVWGFGLREEHRIYQAMVQRRGLQ